MPFTAAHLDALLKATGSSVVYGGVSVYGKLRHEELGFVAEGSAISTPVRRTTLLLRDGALPGLTMDEPITIAGAGYVIRDCGMPRADGTRLLEVV